LISPSAVQLLPTFYQPMPTHISRNRNVRNLDAITKKPSALAFLPSATK
jgi:hypothetical protein